jgi:hypothetical protein
MKPREIAWVGLAGWTLHISRHNNMNGRQLHKISPSAKRFSCAVGLCRCVRLAPSLHRTMAADAKHARVTKEKGSATQAVVVPTKGTNKGKATSSKVTGAAKSTDSELSDYEDAVMAESSRVSWFVSLFLLTECTRHKRLHRLLNDTVFLCSFHSSSFLFSPQKVQLAPLPI